MNMKRNVGLRLKLFRVAADLKQKDIAKRLRVTPNFVSMVERGEREPTLKFLRAFAEIVEVPVSILLWEPRDAKRTDSKSVQLSGKIAALIAEYANAIGVD